MGCVPIYKTIGIAFLKYIKAVTMRDGKTSATDTLYRAQVTALRSLTVASCCSRVVNLDQAVMKNIPNLRGKLAACMDFAIREY